MRVRNIFPFLFLLFFCKVSFVANSQSFANYSVVRNTSVSYNSIESSGTSVPSWRYTGSFSQDDNRSYFIDLGFDFWYNGVRYTQISVSTNGFIDFSTSTDNGGPTADDFGYVNSAFTQVTSGSATRPAIAPFYDDLTAQGGTEALGNAIKYQTSGTAPNRVFTIEWIDMAVYLNTSPTLNFQVKLYETTGVIEINYGTMSTGTHSFSYTLGLNGTTMSAPPTNAQLKTQQTANSTNFSSTAQNNLSSLPASNSQYIFTPPTPANPGSSLSFTAITSSSMTLNWTNWATNEVGYVIYYSLDDINYYFLTQTAANATSATATSLYPSTLYYWRVYAVTEGYLSNYVANSQSTSSGGNKLSNVANGNWNTAASWTPSGVPTASDNVTIRNGHTITINSNADCNNLTVGSGGGNLVIGNNNTARIININGNIDITSTGNFSVSTTSNTTHTMNIKGNITNNGTLNLAPDANSLCNVSFTRINSQTISGSGTTNRFNLITLALGDAGDSLNVISDNFSAATDFLTLTSGIFKIQNNAVSSFIFNNNYTINQFSGISIDCPNASFSFNNPVTLEGLLKINSGTVTIGTTQNEGIQSNGGKLFINGGSLSIAGSYYVPNINNLAVFNITGGTMTLPRVGSTSTTIAPFQMTSSGSSFYMSGGTIILEREGGSGSQNLGYYVTNISQSNVTGGTLQIGNHNTPLNQTFQINTSVPVGNLKVYSDYATAQLVTNNLTAIQDIDIRRGTLNANSKNITLGGNWSDSSIWIPTTAQVIFNGSGIQTIEKRTGNYESFHHLSFSGSSQGQLSDSLRVGGNLTINTGSLLDVTGNNYQINVKGNWLNNGTFSANEGLVRFNGSSNQTMNGTSTTFYDLIINNTAGVDVQSGINRIDNALSLTAGLLSVQPASQFILTSDNTKTARIAPVTNGTVSGNFTIERYISGRAAGYSDMSSPVINSDFSDWDNDMLLEFTYNPPSSYPSAWGYSESLYDYVPVTTTSTTTDPGTGFEVWLDSDGNYISFNATTINTIGTPFIGSLNISSNLTAVNDGWNLIGNPYASYISVDALLGSSSGISNNIMNFDETISDFQVYTAGSGIEIAPHQGFWIQVTGAPSFTFQETHKTTSVNSNYRNETIDFSLMAEEINFGHAFRSHTIFAFDETMEDVPFIGLPHPEACHLFSKEDEKKLRKNFLEKSGNRWEIPVSFIAGKNGNYKIKPLHPELLGEEGIQCAMLLDLKTGIKTDMFTEDGYYFTSSTDDEPNRFKLILSKESGCDEGEEKMPVSFFRSENGINVTLLSEINETARIEMIDISGRKIFDGDQLAAGESYLFSFPSANGVYFIRAVVGEKPYLFKFHFGK
jgi:hypothetical protein